MGASIRGRLLAAAALAGLTALAWGCGGDSGSDGPADGGPDVVEAGGDEDVGDVAPDGLPDVESSDGDADEGSDAGDTTPPELRDLRITIEGEVGSEVDLTRGDETRVLPEPAPASFRIFASDDETAAADLLVRVVDGEEAPVPVAGQSAEFRNGLWTISLTIAAGMSLRVEVEDGAGNVLTSPWRLVLPTAREALVGNWDVRLHGPEQTVTHRWTTSFAEDGTWSEEHADESLSFGGNWYIDETGLFHLAETWRDGPGDTEDDANHETVEREDVTALYVDDHYLELGPFVRDGEGSGLTGNWTRELSRWEPGDGGVLDLVEERIETLVLSDDDTWSETWLGTGYEGDTEVPIDRSWAGTYRVEPNENYTENIGDFLVREVDEVDGVATTDEPERWDLHVVRFGRLLLEPRLRGVE